jgi:acyl transferase domain-containing protein
VIRALLVCPGRGSYARSELGSIERALAALPEGARADGKAAIEAIEAGRAARGLAPLGELDRAASFSPRAHLAPENASDLVFAASCLDLALVRAAEAAGALEVVCVAGNSLGFYTALFAAGALALEDAARLVATMAALQRERGPVGGQLLYPGCEEATWRPAPALAAAVDAALAAAGRTGFAARSIRLGGYEVLAGDEPGLAALLAALPRETRHGGADVYPVRLAGHSAFHTLLFAGLAAAARERLADLPFRAPRAPLVDGRGAIFRPRIAAPRDLFAYTLGTQPVETYDFTTSLRVALREHAPDVVVALGPGDTLGGPIGQTLVGEGWAEIRDREAFRARQAEGARLPLVLGLGRPADRDRLARLAAAG